MIEEEAITDFMDTGLDRDEAIKRIRGGMPAQQESNIEQTAEAQPVERQAINNDSLNAMEALMGRSHNVAGMEGMNTLVKYAHMLHGGK